MRKRILLCDDDLGLLSILAAMLKKLGYSVETARDGIESFSKAIKSQPHYYDLIIIDHLMPGLNGLGLVKELRDSKIPSKIIILSGYLDDELEVSFKKLGVDDILSKPSGANELAECVKALLSE